MKYRNISITTYLFLSMLLSSFLSHADSSVEEDKPVSQVAIMTVSENVAFLRQSLGVVFAPQTQTISSQVTAIVTSERLGMGTKVKKGDVIVSLDSREAKANVDLVESEIIDAKIYIEQQTLYFSRIEETYKRNLVSREEYDNAKLALRRAKNVLRGVQAKLDVAKINLEKHNITAPFSGSLVSSTPVVGLQLSPGDDVVEILNNEELRIKALLTREELIKVQFGEAKLIVQGHDNSPLELLHSAPNANDTNGMFNAEFSIAYNHPSLMAQNALHVSKQAIDNRLYSGQAIKLAVYENKINIPKQVIAQAEGRDYVMTVANEKVVKVALSDLAVGQQVVVLGPTDLTPGDIVDVLPLEELM